MYIEKNQNFLQRNICKINEYIEYDIPLTCVNVKMEKYTKIVVVPEGDNDYYLQLVAEKQQKEIIMKMKKPIKPKRVHVELKIEKEQSLICSLLSMHRKFFVNKDGREVLDYYCKEVSDPSSEKIDLNRMLKILHLIKIQQVKEETFKTYFIFSEPDECFSKRMQSYNNVFSRYLDLKKKELKQIETQLSILNSNKQNLEKQIKEVEPPVHYYKETGSAFNGEYIICGKEIGEEPMSTNISEITCPKCLNQLKNE